MTTPTKGSWRDWDGHISRSHSRFVGFREAMKATGKRFKVEQITDLDWLAVAIGEMGGIANACIKLEVTPQTIYNWLAQGVGTLPFNRVVQIAEASGITLELLKKRTGPYRSESATV